MSVPRYDGKKWRKVVAKGCGGGVTKHGEEFSCNHGYAWPCESCPVQVDRDRERAKRRF